MVGGFSSQFNTCIIKSLLWIFWLPFLEWVWANTFHLSTQRTLPLKEVTFPQFWLIDTWLLLQPVATKFLEHEYTLRSKDQSRQLPNGTYLSWLCTQMTHASSTQSEWLSWTKWSSSVSFLCSLDLHYNCSNGFPNREHVGLVLPCWWELGLVQTLEFIARLLAWLDGLCLLSE
jgi:hypothetical protein